MQLNIFRKCFPIITLLFIEKWLCLTTFRSFGVQKDCGALILTDIHWTSIRKMLYTDIWWLAENLVNENMMSVQVLRKGPLTLTTCRVKKIVIWLSLKIITHNTHIHPVIRRVGMGALSCVVYTRYIWATLERRHILTRMYLSNHFCLT